MTTAAIRVLVIVLLLVPVTVAQAQTTDADTHEDGPLATTVKVLTGAALGLGVHEGGHLTANLLVGSTPGIEGISYSGIPFFVITHEPVSPTKEFAISSAGFWAQHLSSEWLLTRRPRLRGQRAPILKGLLAFNVAVSVMYAGAAAGRLGPPERDTSGLASSANMAEPWVAPIILTPAALDAIRYFHPDSRFAKWASRAAKIGGVLLIVRTRS